MKIVHQGNFTYGPNCECVMDSDDILTVPEMNLTFKEIFYRFRVGAPIPASRNMHYDIGPDTSVDPSKFSQAENDLLNSPDEPDSYADAYAEIEAIKESRSKRRKAALDAIRNAASEHKSNVESAQADEPGVSEA